MTGRSYQVISSGRKWVPTRGRAVYEALTYCDREGHSCRRRVRVTWTRARFAGYWVKADVLLYS